MGFFESAEAQKQQQMAHDPDYGKTHGQIMSEHPLETSLVVVLIIAFFILVMIFIVRRFRKFSQEDKPTTKILEKRASWRMSKVIFWVILTLIIGALSLTTDHYGDHSTAGYGFFLALISYPIFILFRKLYIYVTNTR